MFYKFNAFTGRLGESTQLQAYRPHGFQPEMPLPQIPKRQAEPVRKMASISLTPKAETGLNLGKIPSNKGYQTLFKLQQFFQKTEAEMVWKVNPRAKFFSFGGQGFAAATLALTMYTLYRLNFVGKKD